MEGHASRPGQYDNSPHASSESSALGSAGLPTDDRMIASAFATLNSAVMTPPGSGGTYNSSQDGMRYSQSQAQAQAQGHSHASHLSSSGSGAMPRRHTVSHSYSGLTDLTFLPGSHTTSDPNDAGVMHSGDMSAFGPSSVSGFSDPAQSASLLNSPASSLHGYQYVQDPRHVPSSMPFRRSCQDLPDWPTMNEGAAAASTYGTSSTSATTATGNPSVPSESRKAWREYESLCQALLYSIYLGPDPISFEQRTISFWNSLSAGTREALRNDTMLHNMLLRADGIIFRQLLSKLDGMIGDDVADERMPGLRSLAKMLSEQMAELVRDTLPEACATTKLQASQKMSESLERIIKIFEAIRTFREESMLDGTTDLAGAWPSSDAEVASISMLQASSIPNMVTGTNSTSVAGLRNQSLPISLRGARPRSGTQTSMGSIASPLAGPLANFQLRRRDNSVNSAVSDSQYTWASGENQRASSSASESEVSSMQSTVDHGAQLGSATPNNFFAPLARKATAGGGARSRMASTVSNAASDTSGSISHTFNSLALAGALGSSQLANAMPQTQSGADGVRSTKSSSDSPYLAQTGFTTSPQTSNLAWNTGVKAEGSSLDSASSAWLQQAKVDSQVAMQE